MPSICVIFPSASAVAANARAEVSRHDDRGRRVGPALLVARGESGEAQGLLPWVGQDALEFRDLPVDAVSRLAARASADRLLMVPIR